MKKKQKSRKGIGSKWNKKDYPAALDKLTEGMTKEKFFEFCSIDHLARALKLHRDTLFEWRKTHPEFEEAMERWEQRRNGLWYEFAKEVHPGVWIFAAKNWLGMKDQQYLESKVTETIKFVSKFPILQSTKAGQKKEEEKTG